jgi:DNA-binding transcriptional LysR family regulator
MWLPMLGAALEAGTIDAALTCGDLAVRTSAITTVEIGAQPLLIGLRPGHRLAGDDVIDLRLLGDRPLGLHPAQLFPAWHGAQRQILADAGLAPPTVELEDTDLSARLWTRQPEVEWIMLIASLLAGHPNTVTRPAAAGAVPFTLSWLAQPSPRAVVRRFIECCRAAELPPGWIGGGPGAPADQTAAPSSG